MIKNSRTSFTASDFWRPTHLLLRVCEVVGTRSLIDDTRLGLARRGVVSALQRRDTAAIFDWLTEALSYQGISDRIAFGYMEQYGRVRWHDIADALGVGPSCPKLRGYWMYEGCGYQKNTGSCAHPSHNPACPLPRHDLRNGRLNQTAYSLFLFMRDLADGDIVDGSTIG